MTARLRRFAGPHHEAGSVTVFLAITVVGLLVLIGLVVDGGVKIRAAQHADAVAAEAARAAGQEVALPEVVGHQDVTVDRQGAVVLGAIAVWGVAIVGFGFAAALWLAVICLAVAGAADMVSAVLRTSMLQLAAPEGMRGRMQGVFIAVVAPRVLRSEEACTPDALVTEIRSAPAVTRISRPSALETISSTSVIPCSSPRRRRAMRAIMRPAPSAGRR